MTDRAPSRRSGVDTSVRTAAVWHTVDEHVRELSEALGRPLRVLDLGGGTGGLAVPLAEAGHDVIVVDPSPDALASLRRRATEQDVADRIEARQGDADSLTDLLEGRAVDLVTCHGTLEHVDDPATAVRQLAATLAPGGLLSLLVAQRYAAVLARALAGQFARAREVLDSDTGRWSGDDPLPRRFDLVQLVGLVDAAGLPFRSATGVRIFTDLVPSGALDSDADRQALLALEHAAAQHPSLAALGTAVHVVALRP